MAEQDLFCNLTPKSLTKGMSVLFWCGVLATTVWCGFMSMNFMVSEAYFPMGAKGDLFFPLRRWAFVVPIVVAIVMPILPTQYQPLSRRTYLIGLAILVVAALLPLSPKIDNGYRQVIWLGEDRYEIPWQYGPKGSAEPGGKYLLVWISVQDLIPKYKTRLATISIGKAVDYNFGKGGTVPAEVCKTNEYGVRCQWQRGEFVFSASGKTKHFPSEVSDLMVSVADLLDSFEVSVP